MAAVPPFSENDLRAAVAASVCWADALRFLGYEVKGQNYRTIQRWCRRWDVDTAHFDPDAGRRRAGRARRFSLTAVMTEGSTYPRGRLKQRLLTAGLKQPICEICGQGEIWRGRRMSLILDHINGVADDHRIGNLRIVCPNCAATLDTHCGRNVPRQRTCPGCERTFTPTTAQHRYCSQECWGTVASRMYRGQPRPATRKVERPSHAQLLADLEQMSVSAVGRKHGVSDNAVRKWLRWYANAQPDQ